MKKCRNKDYFYLPKSQARRERNPSMPETWLSLRTRSIISHLKLTHLKAICKCSSIRRAYLGEKYLFLPTSKDPCRGCPHTPKPHSPHTLRSFREPRLEARDKNGNERGRETGTRPEQRVTRNLCRNDPVVRCSERGVQG